MRLDVEVVVEIRYTGWLDVPDDYDIADIEEDYDIYDLEDFEKHIGEEEWIINS